MTTGLRAPSASDADPSGAWTGPLLETLTGLGADTSREEMVTALLTDGGWDLIVDRCVSGSVYTNVHAAETEKVVAGSAGRLYLCRHRASGAWASLWVPFVRVVGGQPVLWGEADAKTRRDWLATSVIAETQVGADLSGLLDIHATNNADLMRVYSPTFAACSTILSLDHPEAEAVQFLAALGGWRGPGLRGDQPLLGRVRDVEFAALSGTRRTELQDILCEWLTQRHRDSALSAEEWHVLHKGRAAKWSNEVTRASTFEGMPEILPPVSVESWPALVRIWCDARYAPVV